MLQKLFSEKFYLVIFFTTILFVIGAIAYYISIFRIQEIKLKCWEITQDKPMTGLMFPSNKAYQRCIRDLGINE